MAWCLAWTVGHRCEVDRRLTHEGGQLALRQAQDERDLVVLELEGHGDHVIVDTIVSKAKGHCVQRRQFSHRC